MYSSILTGCISGIDAAIVHAEVDVSTGLPGFSLVGSLSSEVREAKERVQVALKNAGYHIPPNKITINLSPADLRKEGTGYDVPIAVGLLQSMGYFDEKRTENILFIGELGLDGEIKPVKGILPIVRAAAEAKISCCLVPYENCMEGSMISGIEVRGMTKICDLVAYLKEQDQEMRDKLLPVCKASFSMIQRQVQVGGKLDFSQVKGQRMAKRAAEIAAAGFHNLLMTGAPGGGKSMIAKRILGILPDMTEEECLEVSEVYSVAGMLTSEQPLILRRPFMSPHHTATYSAMVGGGMKVRPGVISLAHRGVLFLDELPEFPRSVLECLRQPLEERKITIARNSGTYSFPADFMLVCAMNPCKCGYYPDKNKCTCTSSDLQYYHSRISGPLLDRIDLCVETSQIDIFHLKGDQKEESTEDIRKRIICARERQSDRFKDCPYHFNGEMGIDDIEKFCVLGKGEQKLLESAYKKLDLSARMYHRILKVARTIADLDGEDEIQTSHLSEALSYRIVERR